MSTHFHVLMILIASYFHHLSIGSENFLTTLSVYAQESNEARTTGSCGDEVHVTGRIPSVEPILQHSVDLFEEAKHCNCHPHDGKGGKIAYLITLHNNRTLFDAQALLRAIAAPGNILLIHIDKKLPSFHYESSDLKKIIEACPCGSDIYVDRIFNCTWGMWNMNEPLHWALTILTSSPRFRDKWDVFMNLSADTLPTYTPKTLSKLFDPSDGALSGINFVTSSSCVTGLLPTSIMHFPPDWHKRQHYLTNPSKDFVISFIDDEGIERSQTLVIYFGSQWITLSPSFVEYLAYSLARDSSLASRFKRELIERKKLMSDETFIATLLANDPIWRGTLPQVSSDGSLAGMPDLYHIRFERMDENVPTAFGDIWSDQRYDVPVSSKADTPKPWGPYYLGVYDIMNIKNSGAIFFRKVTMEIDPNMFAIFPRDNSSLIPSIQWPREVKMIDKPNWDPFKYVIEQAKRNSVRMTLQQEGHKEV